MKKLISVLSILFILGCFSVIYGQTKERIAIIVDKNGIITEAENLDFNIYAGGELFHNPNNRVVFNSENGLFLIPIENLVSIKVSSDENKDEVIIDYYWLGEKRTSIYQTIGMGTFIGDSDFGKFSLDGDDLKELRFNQVSEKIMKKEEFHPDGFLILKNGKKVEFKDLKRYARYSNKVKEVIDSFHYTEVNKRFHTFNENILFRRGESDLFLEFNDIKSIEIGDNFGINSFYRKITLTLKNGKSTKGEILTQWKYLFALTGYDDSGEFWINVRDYIKAVHFY